MVQWFHSISAAELSSWLLTLFLQGEGGPIGPPGVDGEQVMFAVIYHYNIFM